MATIDQLMSLLGAFGKSSRGVVLRRRAGDWHMYAISGFAGIIGGFYIWLEPLRELQLESLQKDAAAARDAKEKK